MRAIPYALSIHHFINTVGADAGFAAIIGLAIVVLLFFAHARETAALRRRATEAEDSLHRLELYVDQIARAGVGPAAVAAPASAARTAPAAAPPMAAAYAAPPTAPAAAPPMAAAYAAPPTAPAHAASDAAAAYAAPPMAAAHAASGATPAGRTVAPVPASVGVLAGAPSAPAGVGAPALSAATRLIPAAGDDTISIRSNRAGTAAAPASAGHAVAVMDPPAPGPSTSAAGANGGGVARVPAPAGATQTMGGRDRRAGRPAAAAPRPAPAVVAEPRRSGRRGGSRVGWGAIVLATALVAVVVVAALLILTSGGSSNKKATADRRAPTTRARSTHRRRSTRIAGAVVPSSVTVAVLNGTSTTNLAHDIMSKLTAAGFKQGQIATASDQTLTATIVGYLPSYRRDALAVAKSLKLGPASVEAVDQSNRAVACSGTTTCPAQVVVTVGTDLAAQA